MTRAASLALSVLAALASLAACGEGSPAAPPALEGSRALAGRTFAAPVELGAFPGDRLFVAQQDGLVLLTDADGADLGTLLDLRRRVALSPGEGLLSIALDPAFAENGALWAYYFADAPPRTVLSRFMIVGDAGSLASELVVLEIAQPGFNQNGGAIRFGPDGMLYLSVGDGSASFDPFDQGQDVGTLLATVLRLDVRTASPSRPYVVPRDNPFLGRAGARPEIWAFGLRNPWRMAFDEDAGALWLADVGATRLEQIERVERGGNHGWSVFEGSYCVARPSECDALSDVVPPVFEYAHSDGRCAAIGGLVYREDAIAGLDGVYVFADLCSGEVFGLDAENPDGAAVLSQGDWSAVSFATDESGTLYLVDIGGPIWELTAR